MKVITNNLTKANKPYRLTCKRCQSVLEVEPSDIVSRYSGDQREPQPCLIFKCAPCGERLWVTESLTGWVL